MGVAPDEQSGSVLDPNSARNSPIASNIGFGLGTALQMLPAAELAARGVNAGAAKVGGLLGPSVDRAVTSTLNRGGMGSNLLQDLAQGTRSNVIVGRPVNVFHGTNESFGPEAFDLGRVGQSSGHASANSSGMWTSRSPKVAQTFINKTPFDKTPIRDYGPRGAGVDAIGLSPWWKDGANVMPIKATLKNPLVLNGADAERKIFGAGDFRDGGDEFAKLVASAKEAGHDGVIIKANPRGSLEFRAEQYLLFDPASQARSKFSR